MATSGGTDAPVLPPIGLGTMGRSGSEAVTLVATALSMGYRHLDTARRYGNETEVGQGLRRSGVARDEVVVTTKLGLDEHQPAAVAAAVTDSLRRLRLDHIDLLLVHWPSPTVPLLDTLDAMTTARDAGLVRGIGVANLPAWMLEGLPSDLGLVTNQVEYHPYLQQRRILDACATRGMTLTAYCPLARGRRLLEDPVLQDVATAHGSSPAQIALAWLVQRPGICAIPGSSDVGHLRSNLEATQLELSVDERAAIDALHDGDRVVDPPHAPRWDVEGQPS